MARAADDRFALWPPLPARLLLAVLAALLVAAALVPIGAGPTVGANSAASQPSAVEPARDDDLALYDVVISRIRGGENYYDVIAEEHRRNDYPLHPGLAVRLPTLAWIDAALGDTGQIVASLALMLAVLLAWWRRLGAEPGGMPRRTLAMAFLFIGVSLGTNRHFFVLHELWSGMLLALAFGLHRPGKWLLPVLVTALALAIREHALPFVLLMGALAWWRGDRKEAAAWGLLALAFFVGLAIHLHQVAQHVLPGDGNSASWFALRGLSGWLSNVVLSSNLRILPHFVAGPLVVLMVLGWAGWRSSAGSFGTLLYLGYALAFMIAGRAENYYWGAMVAPAMFIGLAFAPRALKSLWRAATGRA